MLQFIEKVCIYKNRANSLIPLRTLCGLCVLAKPLGVLSRHPCRIPKPLPLGKGLSVGLPPSPRLGLRPKPHFQKLYRFIDSLAGLPIRVSLFAKYIKWMVTKILKEVYRKRLPEKINRHRIFRFPYR